ncbi:MULTISPECIES: MATE family efflux transporter [unclassified Clostridium]|uniref:MATE family efflux transporter n=1 Tax=unclassified Clostridium TaxID=2614128 RepID=UPI00052CC709|nr:MULTISPECIES: MATE family efflux transporter [unclassified Clostridium]KGK84204.1 multidrug transporter MatE [Clostridium sp. HMP27]
MNESKELETESVGKLLLKFSIPAVIGMLVNALYSIVDRIFVGRGVGSLALSGVAVTFPITNIIMAVGMLVGTGAAAVVSIKLGQKKKEDAEKILGTSYVLTIIMSIIVTILGLIFLEPLLKILGASAETMPYAKQFGGIVLLGTVLQNIGFGLNPIIRSQGDPKTAMNTMLIGAVLNLIINPILIFGFNLGVVGSAISTIASQAVCSIWIYKYFTGNKSLLKLKRENMKLKKAVIKEIIAIGMSPFAMQIAASLVTITINTNLAKYGGDLAIGAYSLIMSIAVLILMPVLGVNQGAQPIIGYNYGAKNISRVKKTLLYSVIVNTCISTVGFILVQLFPTEIIKIFNKTDLKLIALGANGLSIYLMAFALVGPQATCTNYFQAVGKAKYSMFLSLLRQIILLIPLILILPHFYELNGVWISGPIADFVSSVITFIYIGYEMRRLRALRNDEAVDSSEARVKLSV